MSEPENQAIVEAGASTVEECQEVAASETADPSARTASPSGAEAPDYRVLGPDDNREQDETGDAPPDRGPQRVPVLHSLGWLSPSFGDRVGKSAVKPAGLCHHVMESGMYCQSPALRERRYCYNHLRLRGERMRMARAIAQRQPYRLMLPALDDIPSVRAAVARVTDALAAGLLEPQRAGRLLYACQQTSSALRWEARARANPALSSKEPNPTLSPKEDEKGGAPVGDSGGAPAQQRLVEEYPEFEAEFGLPAGLDLSLPPHVVFPPPEQAWPTATGTATAAQTLTYADPPPSRNRWTKEDIEMEELEKRRENMSEQSFSKQACKIHDRISNQVKTEMRKEQEAEWQAEADRRNAFEEEKARVYRSMDDGQRKAYHLGVLSGIQTAQRDAEEEARNKKPAVKAVVGG